MARFKLKDIGTIITGNTPKTSDNRNYDSNDICFVKPSDIDDNKLSDLCSSECYISEYARSKARIVPAQSVLVTCIGIIGKVGINAVDCAFNQQINAIIPNIEKCNCRYLAYAIQRERAKLQSIANAPVVPILNKSQFSDIEISLPPLAEQHKIAAVLDKISDLIAKRRWQLDKLDELVKSRFIEMFGDPITNTHFLPLIALSELGNWNSGGTPPRSNTAYFKGDIDWYSAGELNTLYLEGSVEKITREALENSAAKLFPAGSMLVGMYDTAAFKMGILKRDSASNQACACVEPNDRVEIIWLYYVLQIMKPHFLEQRRGIRQKNLNLGMIRSFQVPYAPKCEQEQFAAFVAQVDKSKLAIQKSLEKLELLKKALMQKYFG